MTVSQFFFPPLLFPPQQLLIRHSNSCFSSTSWSLDTISISIEWWWEEYWVKVGDFSMGVWVALPFTCTWQGQRSDCKPHSSWAGFYMAVTCHCQCIVLLLNIPSWDVGAHSQQSSVCLTASTASCPGCVPESLLFWWMLQGETGGFIKQIVHKD